VGVQAGIGAILRVMGKRGKKAKVQPKARIIPKLGSDSAEARDEGPRLLPLPAPTHESLSHQSRFLELADVALNPKKK
jgi:hypothetical protein